MTRALHRILPSARIAATDLNPPMLARAADVLPASERVRWMPANAQDLPFEDAEFDVVMCQFGVMFFPDRPRAYAEAHRVLRPGGRFVLASWGRIEDNGATLAVEEAFAHDIAVAHCQGTPFANVLAERQVDTAHVTAEMARLLEERFGPEPFAGRLSASIVIATHA